MCNKSSIVVDGTLIHPYEVSSSSSPPPNNNSHHRRNKSYGGISDDATIPLLDTVLGDDFYY